MGAVKQKETPEFCHRFFKPSHFLVDLPSMGGPLRCNVKAP